METIVRKMPRGLTERGYMSTLYEITSEYLDLLELADEDDQAFLDTLDSITGELEVKAESYGVVISEINANIEKFNIEIERLTKRRDCMKNAVQSMKDRLKDAMAAMDKKEIKTDHFTFKIQANGGKLPLHIFGEVPDNYKRVVYEDDTEKIRTELEAGNVLKFAELGVRGKHLQIK